MSKIAIMEKDAMAKILIVEDELNLKKILQDYLDHFGFQTVSAITGAEALSLWRRENPDLILLDLNLPDMDGLDIVREIRKTDTIPIIIVTARAEEIERLIGLELGSDDYIAKPFSPREVVARIKAVLRRVNLPVSPTTILSLGNLQMDLRGHTTSLNGIDLELTPAEFQLLAQFMVDPERAFTRLELLEATQGSGYEGYERTIDMHIKNIRQKLRAIDPEDNTIQTVFGVGYRAMRKA